MPRISIGLPVYNGEKYLRFALNSILQQTYKDFELIISDNASTDASGDICLEFAAKDSRIRYYRNQENIGAVGNFNRVFELSRGEFFKWAPHDDQFHPSFLERCVKVFEQSSPSTVLVFSKAAIIDEVGSMTGLCQDTINPSAKFPYTRLFSLVMNSDYAHPLWGLIKSKALRKTRLMGCFEADHVLLAELVLQGPFVEIPEVLYWERRHAGNAMAVHRTMRELMAWHDPSKAKNRLLLPYGIQLSAEYWKGINNAQVSAVDRLFSYAVILAIPRWRWFLRFTGPARHRLGLRRCKKRVVKNGTPSFVQGDKTI